MDMKEDAKIYEIGFLAKEENDREEIVKILTNYGAKIVDAGKMSRIKLAYPIKKENFAYFGYLFFPLIRRRKNLWQAGKETIVLLKKPAMI